MSGTKMTTDEIMESIMGQVFGAGYVSPRSAAFFGICRGLIDAVPAEDRFDFAQKVLNLVMYARDDALEQ